MRERTALTALLVVTACALLAAGCGPLVEIRATIRADDLTRLEREVLGGRGTVAPARLLLSLEPTVSETAADAESYRRLAER
ncbi:MAG: hypothetical protein R6V05_13895, partial [Candidatus Brocadiia bacterium]